MPPQDHTNITDLDRAVRNATDPGKHKQFNLDQSIAILAMLKPLVTAIDKIDSRLAQIETRLGMTDESHTSRIAQERKDKGPPQVGG